ncbi:hypothetical protein HN011_005389 [Eciton burchellii]|nr:hypothetical protein HN011_005389 [Eciton burchellii]
MNADSKEELNNTEFDMKLQQFHEAAFKIQDMIKLVNNPELYDKLSNADKIKYNFLLSYSLNSIFWMYLRAEGVDSSNHRIRAESERLKKAMLQAKQIGERNSLMPRINKDAAKRFVRNGLWEPKQKRHKSIEERIEKSGKSPPT